jgi:hypothetical protein
MASSPHFPNRWVCQATLGLLMLSLALTMGCSATVYPQASPIDPVTVYLADYGIHSSLLLPNGDGRYVEYAFGDYNFAVLNHCGPNDAIGALLVSFQSALGRRYLDLPAGKSVTIPVDPPPHHVETLYVQRADAERVRLELNSRFTQDGAMVVHNPENNMDFVKDLQHYCIANNCNHLTAHCLREMGCDVKGLVVGSGFSVASRETQPRQSEVITLSTSGANEGNETPAPR